MLFGTFAMQLQRTPLPQLRTRPTQERPAGKCVGPRAAALKQREQMRNSVVAVCGAALMALPDL